VPAVEGYAATTIDDETLTLRLTVIGGQCYADDCRVICHPSNLDAHRQVHRRAA
jgi:hypothetical protein